ncbi:MAG: YwaF family protein [Erysipelotrichaceae bacterium]|nr:YwaF family protein [Erysipelotrichaceae bacterium]
MFNVDIHWTHTPQLYGTIHITMLVLITFVGYSGYHWCRSKSNNQLVAMMHITGALMLLMEIGKQWFCLTYITQGQLSLWYFPWQLCSIAMYLGFLMIFVDEATKNTFVIFLSTFSLVGAIGALVYPEDMLRPQILLTLHGFIYHGLMIILSVIAVILMCRQQRAPFLPAVILFGVCAAIAEVINIMGHDLWPTLEQPNMFYISPYMVINRPFFQTIQIHFGTIIEIVVYLCAIILVSWLVYQMLRNIGGQNDEIS